MKTQNKMTTLFLAATLLLGCNENELTPTTPLNLDYSIVDGDTVKTTKTKDFDKIKAKDPNAKRYISVGDTIVLYKEPKLHTPPAKDPDLSKIKNNDDPDLKGKPLRMVAIGGSLTAGVRDGGYFNEGILTSYPNLIARQMKLKKFEQPLFDAQDYNGFGRKTQTGFNPTGGPVPKFNDVENNLGVESIGEVQDINGNKGTKISLKKYKNFSNVDNLAIPNFAPSGFYVNAAQSDQLGSFDNITLPFTRRILSDNPLYDDPKNSDGSIYRKLKDQKYDFITIEIGIDSHLNFYDAFSSYSTAIGPIRFYELFDFFREKKVKGAIANIPAITDFPYFHQISIDQIKKGIYGQDIYVEGYWDFSGKLSTRKITPEFTALPSSVIDSLASPKVHLALKKGVNFNNPILFENNFMTATTNYDIYTTDNDILLGLANKVGFAFVDLFSMYKKIAENSFITDDGIRVENSMGGNFFSTDGITPTAFGQAVIANEFIKAINSFYKTEIELIPTREYLEIK